MAHYLIKERITDLDGKLLGPDEEGELEIRGAFLFSGYFHNDAANQPQYLLLNIFSNL